MKFGFKTDTVGSVGYSGQPTGDPIAFYVTGSSPGGSCPLLGYLYHQRSGLCVTVTSPTSPAFPRYVGANVQLQPCGSFRSAPPEAQFFCGVEYEYMGSLIDVAFKGDSSAGDGDSYYGSASTGGSSANIPVSLRSMSTGGIRSYWTYACQS